MFVYLLPDDFRGRVTKLPSFRGVFDCDELIYQGPFADLARYLLIRARYDSVYAQKYSDLREWYLRTVMPSYVRKYGDELVVFARDRADLAAFDLAQVRIVLYSELELSKIGQNIYGDVAPFLEQITSTWSNLSDEYVRLWFTDPDQFVRYLSLTHVRNSSVIGRSGIVDPDSDIYLPHYYEDDMLALESVDTMALTYMGSYSARFDYLRIFRREWRRSALAWFSSHIFLEQLVQLPKYVLDMTSLLRSTYELCDSGSYILCRSTQFKCADLLSQKVVAEHLVPNDSWLYSSDVGKTTTYRRSQVNCVDYTHLLTVLDFSRDTTMGDVFPSKSAFNASVLAVDYMPGYCYLAAFSGNIVSKVASELGSFPTVAAILAQPFENFDLHALTQLRIVAFGGDSFHIEYDDSGGALEFLIAFARYYGTNDPGSMALRLRQCSYTHYTGPSFSRESIIGFDPDASKDKVSKCREQYDDLSDRRLLEALLAHRVDVPIVYVTGRGLFHSDTALEPTPQVKFLSKYPDANIDSVTRVKYHVAGFKTRVALLLFEGMSIDLGSTTIHGLAGGLLCVMPTAYTAELAVDYSKLLPRASDLSFGVVQSRAQIVLRVVAWPVELNATWLGFNSSVTDYRFAADDTSCYLHYLPMSMRSTAREFVGSSVVSIVDPLDHWASLHHDRLTFDLSVLGPILHFPRVHAVHKLTAFRSSDSEGDFAPIYAGIVQVFDTDESFSYSSNAFSSMDFAIAHGQVSFHYLSVADPYCYDDGGPSGSDGSFGNNFPF